MEVRNRVNPFPGLPRLKGRALDSVEVLVVKQKQVQ